MEEIPYRKYIEDKDNLIFFLKSREGELFVHMGSSFEELQQISDIANFYYQCNKENEGGVVLVNMIDDNVPYFQLRGASGNLYVKVVDIFRVLRNQNQQLWVLIYSGKRANYTTGISSIAIQKGLNVFRRYVELVNADHCQQGSDKTIYNIHSLQNVK